MQNRIIPVVIRIIGHSESEKAAKRCVESFDHHAGKNPSFGPIELFDAVTPNEINKLMAVHSLHWNYPWIKKEYCEKTDVFKVPYKTTNIDAKIACALSHYLLWHRSYQNNETLLILEHDAEFIHSIPENIGEIIDQSSFSFIGVNDPRGATRKSNVFHQSIIKESSFGDQMKIIKCPWVEPDDRENIQGLAGGSAYIVKPEGAVELLDNIDELGLWHNDCILSHQVLPGSLGVSSLYLTRVQKGIKSTTTA